MHKLHVPRTVSTSGREQLLADLEPPMVEAPSDTIEADLDRLIVTFAFDNGAGDLEPTQMVWADMRIVPAVGDFVRLRAIGVDRDGFAIVRARCWLEANWMTIQAVEIDGGVTAEEPDEDGLTVEGMLERVAAESRGQAEARTE